VDAAAGEPRTVPQGTQDQRAAAGLPRQRQQAGLVHVVIVVVRQQHHVDVGQLLQRQPGRRLALGAGPLHRKATLGEHRVGQQVEPAELQQHGDVPDPGGRGLHGEAGLGVGVDEGQVGGHHGDRILQGPGVTRAPGLPAPAQDFVPALALKGLVGVLKAAGAVVLSLGFEVRVLHGPPS